MEAEGDREGLPLGDDEAEALGLRLGLADALGLKEGEAEGLRLGDLLGLAEADGLKLGLAEGLLDGDALGLAEGLAEGLRLGDALGDLLGLAEGLRLGDLLGLAEADGLKLGLAEGLLEGETLGLADGLLEGDPGILGEALGEADGLREGDAEGLRLGLADGDKEGDALGLPLALAEGESEGLTLGDALGLAEGLALTEGEALGLAEGLMLGEAEGPLAAGAIAKPTAAQFVAQPLNVIVRAAAVPASCGSEYTTMKRLRNASYSSVVPEHVADTAELPLATHNTNEPSSATVVSMHSTVSSEPVLPALGTTPETLPDAPVTRNTTICPELYVRLIPNEYVPLVSPLSAILAYTRIVLFDV